MNQQTLLGTVSEVFPRMCNVVFDDESKLLCTYRRAKVIDTELEWRERSPVAPGDFVQVLKLGSKDGVVEGIEPRKNKIQRRAPGKEGKVLHTLAANIDALVIVASLDEPRFSPGLVDRFLVGAQQSEVPSILVINKTDLANTDAPVAWELYQKLGIPCFPISTISGEGVDVLRNELTGKTSVFCGHSGVGKTSLLESLFGNVVGKIGKISTSTGKGRHTTTVSKMILAAGKTRFIDTPGIKEFGLIDLDPKDLIQYFPELHEKEIQREPITEMDRYSSYTRIKEALKNEGR